MAELSFLEKEHIQSASVALQHLMPILEKREIEEEAAGES
jgi:hypothetical protein